MRSGVRLPCLALMLAASGACSRRETTYDLVQQTNARPGADVTVGWKKFPFAASLVTFRETGPRYEPSRKEGGRRPFDPRLQSAATLVFGDGSRQSLAPMEAPQNEMIVFIPRGYGPHKGKPSLILQWPAPKGPRSRTYSLQPLPDPARLLPKPTPDSRVLARHVVSQGTEGIEISLKRTRPEEADDQLRLEGLTYQNLSGGLFVDTTLVGAAFLGDQDAVKLSLDRVTHDVAGAVLSLDSARLITSGGAAFLDLPHGASATLGHLLRVSIPNQQAPVNLLVRPGRTGRQVLLKCVFKWLTNIGDPPSQGLSISYEGRDLSRFGLDSLHLSGQPMPRVSLPAEARPLRLGPLPSFAFRCRLSLDRTRHLSDLVIPIEAR